MARLFVWKELMFLGLLSFIGNADLTDAATTTSGIIEDMVKPYLALLDDIFINLGQSNWLHNNTDCIQQTNFLLTKAKAGETSALKFLDATGKLASGLLEGGVSFPGFFSECVNAQIGPSDESSLSSRGKYCLLSFNVSSQDSITSPIPPVSWAVLTQRNPMLGICIPSACSVYDVHLAASIAVQAHFTGIQVDLPTCSPQRVLSQDVAAMCILSFFVIVMVIAVLATVYDIFKNRLPTKQVTVSTEVLCEDSGQTSSLAEQCLLSFSLKKNASKLLAVENKSSENIGTLHGLRFYSMVLIIFGHTYSFANTDLFFRNPATASDAPKQLLAQIFANGTLAVDTFYYMSGLLVAYVMLKVMNKNEGKFPFGYFYIHRYVRLTPLFLIVIAFSATLLRYTGSGPKWDLSIMMYDEWCRKNWWINALYLHNFIDTENMCLSHSWYLATDMQFYIITPLILIPLNIKLLYGAVSLGVLFIASALTSGILTGLRGYPAVPYINNALPIDVVNEYYKEVYIKPYCRIGPYLVGIVMGYILFKHKDINLKKAHRWAGWIATIASMLFVIFIMYGANQGKVPSPTAAAFYSAFARSVWGCGLAWITLVCHRGHGGWLNSILSCSAIVPLSRLTYCAYLIHPVIMAVYYGDIESLVDFSNNFMIYTFLGNVIVTYGLSFILTLLFESPLIGLEKALVFRKVKKEKILPQTECKMQPS